METASYGVVQTLEVSTGARERLSRPAAVGRCTSGPAPRPAQEVPREDHRYTWLEDHLMRLEGKEARGEYYARLR
ncbi:MAG TPA: hypothetical protein VFJ72_09560 [Rubrobacteraceae bacterium]|nr:hypothetical protein [Rubrobacteraceae bacterium]